MRARTVMLVAGAAFVGALIAALPSTAALAADTPDLVVTGSFNKASYVAGETFTLTVKVTNKGTVAANHVHVEGGDNEGIDIPDLGEIHTGFDLAAGATKTVAVTGTITATGKKAGRAHFGIQLEADNGEANDEDNILIVRTRVTGAFGNVSGLIFPGDDISSVPQVGGPGVPGVKVVILDETTDATYGEATTDANGKFRVEHLPAGVFRVRYTPPAGWKILLPEGQETDNVQVFGDETSQLQVVAKQVASPSPSVSTSTSSAPSLPITGSSTALLVAAGLATIAVGTGLFVVARRRRIRLEV